MLLNQQANLKIQAIKNKFKDSLKKIYELMGKLSINKSDISKDINENLLSKGKLLRPILLLSFNNGLNQKPNKEIIYSCIILEYIHCASIIHDDIIDHNEMRHGVRTAHLKWDIQSSILSGDFILCRALKLSQELPAITTNLILNYLENITLGELYQKNENKNLNLDVNTYLNIISKKTGTLFGLALCIPLSLQKQYKEQFPKIEKTIYTLGSTIGATYQILDDCCDYISNFPDKTPGNDIQEGIVTLPLIYLIQQANSKEKQIIQKEFLQPQANSLNIIKELMLKYAIFEKCYSKLTKLLEDNLETTLKYLSKNNIEYNQKDLFEYINILQITAKSQLLLK